MYDVSPLFRVPSCVYFGHKAKLKYGSSATNFKGIKFSGQVSEHNQNLTLAKNEIEETPVTWHLIRQGKTTAYSTKKTKSVTKTNPYKAEFKQGATIVPRAFYFIELEQDYPEDFEDRIINIKTSEAVKVDSKKPWKLELKGKVESKFIFRTALAKSILPFALYKPDLTVLPILIENDNGIKKIKLQSANDLIQEGYLNASKWFKNAENIWEINKTEKSKKMSSLDRLNFQKGLTDQDLNKKHLVLYNSSAKNANATMIRRDKLDLEFLVESVTYVFSTNNIQEAYYLTSLFNSNTPNELMKAFQARGLFGARHVHKKILDIYFPKFDKSNEAHLKLAELSETAHKKTAKYLEDNPPQKELSPIRLGKLRLDIKKHLSADMKEIDKLVKKLLRRDAAV